MLNTIEKVQYFSMNGQRLSWIWFNFKKSIKFDFFIKHAIPMTYYH